MGILETTVSGGKANPIISSLGFKVFHQVEDIGFFRGIWVGWKEWIRIEIIRSHPQFIIIQVSDNFFHWPIFVTFFYGSLDSRNRKHLSDVLKNIIPSNESPWVAIGDFNTLLSPSEKRGGPVNGKRYSSFGEFLESPELNDLGFRGSPFT